MSGYCLMLRESKNRGVFYGLGLRKSSIFDTNGTGIGKPLTVLTNTQSNELWMLFLIIVLYF